MCVCVYLYIRHINAFLHSYIYKTFSAAFFQLKILTYIAPEGALSIMVIILCNGIGNLSSNPG